MNIMNIVSIVSIVSISAVYQAFGGGRVHNKMDSGG